MVFLYLQRIKSIEKRNIPIIIGFELVITKVIVYSYALSYYRYLQTIVMFKYIRNNVNLNLISKLITDVKRWFDSLI